MNQVAILKALLYMIDVLLIVAAIAIVLLPWILLRSARAEIRGLKVAIETTPHNEGGAVLTEWRGGSLANNFIDDTTERDDRQQQMMTLGHRVRLYYGEATWYGEVFAGHKTADGSIFDPDAFTCAAAPWWVPMGSILLVRRAGSNDPWVQVSVTDRGAFHHALNLSRAAFEAVAKPAGWTAATGRMKIEFCIIGNANVPKDALHKRHDE